MKIETQNTMIKNAESIACSTLKGVGPRIIEHLSKLHIKTINDLIFHLPSRYEDRTRIIPIRKIRIGMHALIRVVITHTEIKHHRSRSSLLCFATDKENNNIALRFFHYISNIKNRLTIGAELLCYGEIRMSNRLLEMIHPEYTIIDASFSPSNLSKTLTPIYPVTAGLSQKAMRSFMQQALTLINQSQFNDELSNYCQTLHLPTLINALNYVHNPSENTNQETLLSGEDPHVQRLAFEELLAHYLSMRLLRKKNTTHQAPCIKVISEKDNNLFLQQLPFTLTNAQKRVINEISQDLQKNTPMMRLLQGDVGSGKTLVAAMAALQAIQSGYQVAIMAPTEVLAEQHRNHFKNWLSIFNINIAWLTSSVTGKTREQTLHDIQTGEALVIVGTHAIFQDQVDFHKLGLIIIDEQHRFGVHQRMLLRDKGKHEYNKTDLPSEALAKGGQFRLPHQLVMTATPIPRTLAMSAYADLDHSILDELPPGRTPVNTTVISQHRREEIMQRIAYVCSEGRQVYWVCTLIEESEQLQCQAAEQAFETLKATLPNQRIALLHGQMKNKEKELIMQSFKQHEYDVLVATTVIEVGVDVPNASLMVIENAERFGLSQLHQLRGRVGRGPYQSHCVLLYQSPLSQKARARLNIMRETQDGFRISEEDLKLRGPGEILGTRQTGDIRFRIASLQRDQLLMTKIPSIANELLYKNLPLVDLLIHRWMKSKQQYSKT